MLQMLRSAHALKGTGKADRSIRTGTTMVLLGGLAIETFPIMEHVLRMTTRELVNEELQRGRR